MAALISPEASPTPIQGYVKGSDGNQVIEQATAPPPPLPPIRETFAAGWWLEFGEPCASGTCPTGFTGG